MFDSAFVFFRMAIWLPAMVLRRSAVLSVGIARHAWPWWFEALSLASCDVAIDSMRGVVESREYNVNGEKRMQSLSHSLVASDSELADCSEKWGSICLGLLDAGNRLDFEVLVTGHLP